MHTIPRDLDFVLHTVRILQSWKAKKRLLKDSLGNRVWEENGLGSDSTITTWARKEKAAW